MTRAEIERTLAALLTERFSVEPGAITPSATFRGSLRLDSIDVLNLIEDVETTFGIRAEMAEYRDLHEVGLLVEFISARSRP